MKQWLKITLWILFCSGVTGILILAQMEQSDKPLPIPETIVHITDGNAFLNEKEVYRRLKRAGFLYNGQLKKELNVASIEKFIGGMTEVKSVRVYSEIGQAWKIDIEVRKPIARVFNKYRESFYLDEDGVVMQVSPIHTARVLVVNGEIKDRPSSFPVDYIINNDSLKTIRKLDDIYRISNYVCKHPYMKSLISQIYLKENGDFVMMPIVGEQQIVFGTARTEQEVREKFEKLQIFYKEAIPYEGWEKYSEINLKYGKQVVAKLKIDNTENN
jgi:cell division protein FtsQ